MGDFPGEDSTHHKTFHRTSLRSNLGCFAAGSTLYNTGFTTSTAGSSKAEPGACCSAQIPEENPNLQTLLGPAFSHEHNWLLSTLKLC